jgi:uncharacterized membrane protein YhhN
VLFVAVVMLVRGELAGEANQIYLFKPLATLLVVTVAFAGPRRPAPDRYATWVFAGLGVSLIGDVLLMMPGDLFVPGLVAFLVAHICYTYAFTRDRGFSAVLATGVPLVLLGAGLLVVLWDGLGPLKVPVIAYVGVILTMAWQAVERWRLGSHAGARLAGIGALCFIASDAALGIARFRGDFHASAAVILGTYYVAQFLIARSIHLRAQR